MAGRAFFKIPIEDRGDDADQGAAAFGHADFVPAHLDEPVVDQRAQRGEFLVEQARIGAEGMAVPAQIDFEIAHQTFDGLCQINKPYAEIVKPGGPTTAKKL